MTATTTPGTAEHVVPTEACVAVPGVFRRLLHRVDGELVDGVPTVPRSGRCWLEMDQVLEFAGTPSATGPYRFLFGQCGALVTAPPAITSGQWPPGPCWPECLTCWDFTRRRRVATTSTTTSTTSGLTGDVAGGVLGGEDPLAGWKGYPWLAIPYSNDAIDSKSPLYS